MVLRGLTIDQKSLKDHKEAFDYVRELVQEQAPCPSISFSRYTFWF